MPIYAADVFPDIADNVYRESIEYLYEAEVLK
jgi:hypothetical protein